MKINPVIATIIVVVIAFGAIAFLRNAQFQEEKRQASIEISRDKAACDFKRFAESEVEIAKYLAEKNSSERAYYEEKKKAVEAAESSCKKVADYKAKYGSP
jgi:hypothetical protein